MADELNYKINAELEFNEKDAAKKLEAAAKRLNMTGKDVLKELNLEVKVDMLDIGNIANEIHKISKAAEDAKMDLQELFKIDPSAKSGLFSGIKSKLNLVPEDALSSLRAVNTRSRKPVGLQDEMSRIMFGETGVKFEIAAFKKEITSREKKYVEDFGNEAIDFVDLIADDSEQLILKLNEEAKKAAKQAGVKFVGASEAFTQFNDLTLEDDADKLIGALRLLAEGISLTGSHIAGGERVLGESLTLLVSDFVVNKKGTFTVSPAMALDAYYKAIENIGLNLVTQSKDVKKTSKQRNFMKPGTFQEVFEKQAPDNVVAYLKNQLESLASKKDGSSKLAAKMSSIEEFVFQQIFDAAQKAAERALKDKKTFDRKQLDIYAPSADIEAIGGSADTENLMRYAEEAAAKAAHETELKLGVQPGTFAKYASTRFSKKFQELFGEIESRPNALFDPAKTFGAIRNKSFIDNSGSHVSPATSALVNVKPLFDQILENPAIIEKLIGTDSSALAKKSAAFLKQKLDSLGKDLPSDPKELDSLMSYLVEVSRMLAFVQSFVDQTKRIKPINNKDLLAQWLTPVDKSGKPIVEPVRSLRAKEYPNSDYTEIKKSNKEYGEKLAKEIAIYRNKLKEAYYVSPDELDAQVEEFEKQGGLRLKTPSIKTKEDAALYTRQGEYNKRIGQERARRIAIRRQAEEAALAAQPAIPVSMQAPAGQKPVAQVSILEDWLTRQRRDLEKAQQQHGPGFAVAFDTEFNNQVKQFLTECSIVFKDASGQFRSLLDFINIPSDAERLANGRAGEAQNAKDLIDRAEKLGIPREKIGGTGNKKLDQELTYKQAQALVATIEMVQGLGIPFTGSNLPAEQNAIKNFIKYVNTFAESIGQEQLPTPNIMANVFDSFREFKNLPRTNDIVSKLPLTPKKGEPSTGLQNVFAEIARQFPELLSEFSGFVRMTKNGPLVKTLAGGKEVPAHFAQADAIMSLIVNELWQRIMPPSIAARAVPTPKPGSTGGGGKPPTNPPTMPPADGGDDPMASRRANNLARLFHTTSEYVRMVNGLTEAELKIARDKLSIVRKNSEQVTLDANLTTVEKQLAEKRIENARIRKTATKQELVAAQPGFIGPAPSANGALIQEYTQLQEAQLKATRKGRKEEQEIIDGIFEQRKAKEGLLLNTRRQLDAEIELNQAGKQFTAQVKANIKAEIDAQKQLQRVNKEQINQWVTARYALYDVGNFYTNIYQQMFRLTRQIFASTQAYRSYETAFTSVERAMQLTAEGAIDVKNQFILLSQEIPIAFEELSKIATLGAQMGISASGIQAFTENIAQFASVTGISADTVAQKFGRIAELAKVDSSDFNKLGSAVAYAGVNAVATESEILNLSEAIAAVSTNVGFTPQEVVGLSTALASVGVQAEQARGVFTRVFADIDRAVSKGGPALDAFAKASGMSSEAFAQAWGKDGKAGAVFRQFLGGLGASSDITKTFDSLNIVESREINTLTRLAKSLGVVDQAMSDANISYAEGTFLSDSFSKTVDNLDSQITIFKNNLNSLSAAFGEGFGKPLKDIVAFGSKVLEFAKGGASSGWASGLGLASMLITGIGGAAALATSGVTKLIAQIYALRVAQIQSLNASATDVIGPVNRIKQLTGAYAGLIEMRSELQGIAGPEVKGVVTPVTYGVKDQIINQKNALMEFVKTRDFAAARAILANGKENELLAKSNIYLVTANSHRAEAVLAARAEADAVQRVIQAEKSRNAAIAERDGLNAAQVAELNNKKFFIEVVNGQKAAVSAETVAELQNTLASKASTVAQREQAAARLANIDATRALTAETEVASTATMRFGSRLLGIFGKIGAWGAAAAGIISIVGMLSEAITKANDIKLLEGGGGVTSLRDAIAADTKAWKENGDALATVQVEYTNFEDSSNSAANASSTLKAINGELSTVFNDTADAVKYQTLAIGENTKQWTLNAIVGNEKVNQWLEDNPGLFTEAEASLKSYGTSFSTLMTDVMSDPMGGGADKALKNLDLIFQDLNKKQIAAAANTEKGFDPKLAGYTKQLNNLIKIKTLIEEISKALKDGLDASNLMKSLAGALGVSQDLEDSTNKIAENVAKSVKTLTQWAGEVGQVMQSAFDIRYGKITALDNVRKAWFDLKKRVDDAKKAIKKAQDQMNSLKATKGVLEYQLGVALKYGDSKRAAEIQAKLAENATSISEAAEQEAEAQKNASMELRDGSEAAIQNRAALGGLVQSYIPYIQALLNSGKSQKEVAVEIDKLKEQFAAQAKEIGFADKDLEGYIGTFNTYKTVVQKMDKNVTVKVNGLDAATRAMREFAAAINGVTKAADDLPDTINQPTVEQSITQGLYKLRLDANGAEAALKLVNKVEFTKLDLEIGNIKSQMAGIAPTVQSTLGEFMYQLKTRQAQMLSAAAYAAKIAYINAKITYYDNVLKSNPKSGDSVVNFVNSLNAKLSMLTNDSKAGVIYNDSRYNFASGGYVSGPGTGTSDSIPVRLSNGEFVMSAKSVSTYGVDFMNALNQSKVLYNTTPMQQSQAQSGTSLVYLSPDDRALLRAAIDRPVNLYADSTRLAQSVNNGNKILAQRGTI